MVKYNNRFQLYVYNVDSDGVREVTLTPNSAWGGEGCLGCDIGYGYLHRIPVSVDRSKPTEEGASLLAGSAPKPDPAGSQTGIPQVDQLINVFIFLYFLPSFPFFF